MNGQKWTVPSLEAYISAQILHTEVFILEICCVSGLAGLIMKMYSSERYIDF